VRLPLHDGHLGGRSNRNCPPHKHGTKWASIRSFSSSETVHGCFASSSNEINPALYELNTSVVEHRSQ